MSDNRQRPRIHRTDDKHDKVLRDYAAEHGIEPWKALEVAIRRLEIPDVLPRDARADLESAREATRRADAEIERITADWRAALAEVERIKTLALERAGADATEIKRLREQYEAALDAVPSAAESRADRATISALRSELAEVRAALATKGATDRLAERVETIAADVPKIPRKLMARVKARIKARPNANPPRTFLFVLENGCDRLEASDRYQDKVKRANRIKRAVARMPRKTKRAAKGA